MTRESLAELLNRFPEVRWDRMAIGEDLDDNGVVFGWIERDDGRFDFLVIEWDSNFDGPWMTTLSARYSRDFDRRMRGTDEGHQDCERVEDLLGDLVKNKVELAA